MNTTTYKTTAETLRNLAYAKRIDAEQLITTLKATSYQRATVELCAELEAGNLNRRQFLRELRQAGQFATRKYERLATEGDRHATKRECRVSAKSLLVSAIIGLLRGRLKDVSLAEVDAAEVELRAMLRELRASKTVLATEGERWFPVPAELQSVISAQRPEWQ